MSASYIKKITGNFLPTAVGGSSSTFVTDAWWSSPTGTTVLFGGNAGGALAAGGFSVFGDIDASGAGASVGASLSR